MNRITIKDVAKDAGVSVTSTSFALNNIKGRVSEEVRQRVLESVKRLGYIPNATARNLRIQSSNTIALIYDETYLDDPNASTLQFVSSVIKHAGKCGKDILVKLINSETGWEKGIQEYINMWASKKIEGLIIQPGSIHINSLQKMKEKGVNFVVIPPTEKINGFQCVYIDNYALMKSGIEYLYGKGYKEIYYLGAKTDSPYERERGYSDTVKKLGLKGNPLYYTNRFRDKNELWEIIKASVETKKEKMAIACWNDVDAINILEILQDRGIRVPEDVGVLGFDDIPASGHSNPALSTIRQPFELMAEVAVDVLLEKLQDEDEVKSLELKGEIVNRKSI